MKGAHLIWACLGFFIFSFTQNLSASGELLPQRLLYVGHRPQQFAPFLREHFSKVETVDREQFKPAQAADFDVVLVDWPQHYDSQTGTFRREPFLGKREEWGRPTVLLGSAGLNLAVLWKLKGGSGCTCLAPVACNFNSNHEIFHAPLKIQLSATTNIPTPAAFVSELKTPTTDVLPLVNNIRHFETVIRDNNRGWCTYYKEFADVPEVEFFCGGINEKTYQASALWRQGNLMHFGFEQAPAEMNATGRALLVNAIVYISRFSEDRPIDITPSVFGPEKIGDSRRRAKKFLLGGHPTWAKGVLADSTLASFKWTDHDAAEKWFVENGSWLHPGKTNLLEVDEEAKSFGVPYDSAEFLPKTIEALRTEKTRAVAAILLGRYVATGPGADASAEVWEKWWRENSPYLFFSELGCYRWYIDPLAKKRGIPWKQLRGPARADKGR